MSEIVAVTTSYEVTQLEEGKYEVKQVPSEPQADLNSGSRKEFSIDVGFIAVVGWFDPDSQSIGVYPKVFGNQIGDGYSASLQTGLQIQLVLALYNGHMRFFKKGDELVMGVHLSPLLWGDDINQDITLLTGI